MKKNIFIFIILIPIAFLFGCGTAENINNSDGDSNRGDYTSANGVGDENKEEENMEKKLKPSAFDVVNNLEGVEMEIEENTVTPTGLTVIFNNETDKECIFGEYYILEKNVDGNWYEVPVIIDGVYAFESIGYNLEPSKTRTWSVNWEWLYGNLDPGEYRIVKDVLIFREAGDYDKHFLTAEFVIGM